MGPPWIDAIDLACSHGEPRPGRVLLFGSYWHVVARALREEKERHLGSLRGTLDPGTFVEEDWGFLAQQTLEKLLKALLVLHCQEPPHSHSLQRLLQEPGQL
jgi:hypothetical protein